MSPKECSLAYDEAREQAQTATMEQVTLQIIVGNNKIGSSSSGQIDQPLEALKVRGRITVSF